MGSLFSLDEVSTRSVDWVSGAGTSLARYGKGESVGSLPQVAGYPFWVGLTGNQKNPAMLGLPYALIVDRTVGILVIPPTKTTQDRSQSSLVITILLQKGVNNIAHLTS